MALVLLSCALAGEARAARDDLPSRAWRAVKRIPGDLADAASRAMREFEAGLEEGRRGKSARRPPAQAAPGEKAAVRAEAAPATAGAAPEPEADLLPGAEVGRADAAFLAGAGASAPASGATTSAAGGSAPRSALAPASAPIAAPERRPSPGAPILHGVLLGALGTLALGAGALLVGRRLRGTRRAVDTSAHRAAPALHELPTLPLVRPDELPTRPRAPLDPDLAARSEAALAAALASAYADRPTPFPGAGRYQLLEEIGRGGMGVVYRAHDKRLDRIVALKRLTDDLQAHPRAVQLLLREARAAAQLNHPNIVTVYDVDHEDGAYFITMELLEGHTLASLLRRRGRFTAPEAVWLAHQAASGLAYAHERRIVHRDVKTANLFLTRDRVVKIMDFGLAKMVEAVRRRSTRIGGTPDYMAPEQALGLEVDGRADLYALGVTLYELLTGSVPFAEGDTPEQRRHAPAPDPRERAPETPAVLAELVLELLAPEPERRPASAAEVVERLRAIDPAALRAAAGG
ncbi:MAG TPA: serine/threonine-protein kinase [Myxococcota bacterium]